MGQSCGRDSTGWGNGEGPLEEAAVDEKEAAMQRLHTKVFQAEEVASAESPSRSEIAVFQEPRGGLCDERGQSEGKKKGDEVGEVLGRGQTREEFKFIVSAVVVSRGLPGD